MENNNSIVWLIDDDEVFQFIFKRQLAQQHASKKLTIFPNGKKGLEALMSSLNNSQELPDSIFLDINMPIMSGWQFLEAFATIKDKLHKNIKIYLITSSIDERDIEKANTIAEVKDYLIKPIVTEKMVAIFN